MPDKAKSRTLTATNLDTIRPGERLKDNKVIGLYARRHKNSTTFFYRYRAATLNEHGTAAKQVHERLGRYGPGMGLEDARRAARKIAGAVAGGTHAAPIKGYVKDLAQRYLDSATYAGFRPETKRQWDKYLDRYAIKGALGGKRLSALTPHDIDALYDAKARKTPFAANRLYDCISAMFSWAIKNDLYVGKNPCQQDRRKHKELERDARETKVRYLTREELKALVSSLDRLHATNPRVADAIRLILLTGCRKNEILALRWDAVDFERGWLNLRGTKTGFSRRKLSDDAMEIIQKQHREADNPYVFPSPRRDGAPLVDIFRTWDAVRAEAGIQHIRLHDLRHTFASLAINAGETLEVIGELLGHKDIRTTQRYAHLIDSKLGEATNKIANMLK